MLWLWKDFVPAEVDCSHCGRMGVKPDAMDALQRLRSALRRPLRINSAYRCPEHNKAVGGAKNSQHLMGTAFDISTYNMGEVERLELLDAAKEAGFTGFGFYNSFLHVDIGPSREWGSW